MSNSNIVPRANVEKLFKKLVFKSTWGRKAQEIVQVMDVTGRAKLSDIRDRYFGTSKNIYDVAAAIRSRIDKINDAARSANIPIEAVLTASQEDGERYVQVEHLAADTEPMPDLAEAQLTELDGARKQGVIVDREAVDIKRPFVLLTFNPNETDAVLKTFSESSLIRETRNGVDYYNLGVTDQGEPIYFSQSRQGNMEAKEAADKAHSDYNAQAVIAVGVAFGTDPEKQRIGDVLVSTAAQDYETACVNPNNQRNYWGSQLSASPSLIRRFSVAHSIWASKYESAWPRSIFGCFLSGSKLINAANFRKALVKIYKNNDIVGGDMEAYGIYRSAMENKIDSIVVKGISDFAKDIENDENKQEQQQLAAKHAAWVVYAVLKGELPNDFHAYINALKGGAAENAETKKNTPEAETKDLREICNREIDLDVKGMPANKKSNTSYQNNDIDKESEEFADEDSDAQIDNERKNVLTTIQNWVNDKNSDDESLPLSVRKPLFALLGEYGMGKTITCQLVTEKLREEQKENTGARVPLYFDLRHVTGLGKKVPTVDEVMVECAQAGWKRSSEGHTADSIWSWILGGAVVIFDGLDEVLTKINRADGQAFTNRLLSVIDTVEQHVAITGGPRPKVLISSRTEFFRTLREELNRFTGSERGNKPSSDLEACVLSPLTPEQIRKYLEASLPERDVSQVVDMLGSIHDLSDFTQRPYTLKLVTELVPELEQLRREDKSIHASGVYREIVRKWLVRDDLKHTIQIDHKLLLAEDLAAYLAEKHANGLPVNVLEDWFHEWRVGKPGMAKYASLHYQLLEEDLRNGTFLRRVDKGLEDAAFRFAHTSLREFFMSEYLVRALKEDAPERWKLPASTETFDFVGQTLAESGNRELVKTLQGWTQHGDVALNTAIVKYAVAAHKHEWSQDILQRIDIDLRGIDLCEADLSEVSFKGINLTGVNLSKADLGGANFTDSTLNNANLIGAELKGSVFWRCSAVGSNWAGASGIAGKYFFDCDFRESKWGDEEQQAEVKKAWFVRCKSDVEGPVGFEVPEKILSAHRIPDTDAVGEAEAARRAIVSGHIGTGGLVTIGSYVWRVLQIKNTRRVKRALLLSEYLVDMRPYHNEDVPITWEECSLRQWLNGEFYSGLPDDFQDRIHTTKLTNRDNTRYSRPVPGGKQTDDNVFLLSLDDVDPRNSENMEGIPFLKSPGNRIGKRHDGEAAWWWLRSPGSYPHYAAVVRHLGYVSGRGLNVDGGGVAVRPALWFNLES